MGLLWNLAHSEDVPTDIMDQALTAHIKILDYSCSQVKHTRYPQSFRHVPTDIMDQALTAHIKILDYSCSQVKHTRYPQSFRHVPTDINKALTAHIKILTTAVRRLNTHAIYIAI